MLIHIGEYKPGQRQQRTRWKLQKQKEERKEKNRQSINSQFHFFFSERLQQLIIFNPWAVDCGMTGACCLSFLCSLANFALPLSCRQEIL